MNQLDHAKYLLSAGLIGPAYKKLLLDSIKRLEAQHTETKHINKDSK